MMVNNRRPDNEDETGKGTQNDLLFLKSVGEFLLICKCVSVIVICNVSYYLELYQWAMQCE